MAHNKLRIGSLNVKTTNMDSDQVTMLLPLGYGLLDKDPVYFYLLLCGLNGIPCREFYLHLLQIFSYNKIPKLTGILPLARLNAKQETGDAGPFYFSETLKKLLVAKTPL